MWWRSSPSRKELMMQLSELTRQMTDVTEKLQKQTLHVTVESLHVDKASLEQLVFRLDSLDIHELSGSLNLGNNFGQTQRQAAKTEHQVRMNAEGRSGPRQSNLGEQSPSGEQQVKDLPEKDMAHDVVNRSDESSNLLLTKRGYAIRF